VAGTSPARPAGEAGYFRAVLAARGGDEGSLALMLTGCALSRTHGHPRLQSAGTRGGTRDRDMAWQRQGQRKYREVRFANQRVGEQFMILSSLHLSRPESF